MASVETWHGDASSARFSFGDGKPLGWEVVTAGANGDRHRALLSLRAAFRDLAASDDDTKRSIDWRYDEDRGVYNGERSIVQYCAEASLTDLSDVVYGNARKFHRQERVLGRSEIEIRQAVVKSADQLADITPEGTFKDYLKTIRTIGGHLRPIDSFEAGGIRANGYYVYGRQKPGIYLSNLFIDRNKTRGVGHRMRETAFHEYSHALGDISDKGFFTGLDVECDNSYLRLLEEPAVAYLTKMAMGSSVKVEETLNANTLSNTDFARGSSYQYEQLLIDWLDAPADEIREAFFTERSEDGSGVRLGLRRRLDKSVINNFPEFRDEGFYGMAESYNAAASHERPRLVQGWLDRLGMIIEDEVPDDGPSFVVSTTT